jgi:hypothetical protein
MRPPVVTQKQVGVLVVQASELLPTQSSTTRYAITNPTKTSYDNQILWVVGTIAEILNVQGVSGAYSVHARPSDVRGCTAEYVIGDGWKGCLGIFNTQEEFENAITPVVNVGTGAWVLVGTSETGVSMNILQ